MTSSPSSDCVLPILPLSPPKQVEVSPLENAIEVIENKNLQLRTLITQCQNRQMQNINPLTMCLNGVIDAAVNGGLARYQEVGMDGRMEGWTDQVGRLLEMVGGRGDEGMGWGGCEER